MKLYFLSCTVLFFTFLYLMIPIKDNSNVSIPRETLNNHSVQNRMAVSKKLYASPDQIIIENKSYQITEDGAGSISV